MRLAMLSRFGRPRAAAPARATTYFRPGVEGLEDRLALASPGTLALPLAVTDIQVLGTGAARQLDAVVTFAGQVSQIVPLDLTTTAQAGQECPVLNLHLGPINLNLLGLHVDTSQICLDVTAVDHQGLLGGLLCDLTGGLNLTGILDQLGGQLDTFLGDLDRLLDGVLGRAMTVTNVFGAPVGGGPTAQQDEVFCDVLNLSLGPVDLEVPLLGVNVSLDNCEGGPVTVDVTADPNGGLLGSLLCSLEDGINLRGVNLNRLIDRVDRLLDRVTDLAGRLGQLDQIIPRVEKLLDRLEKLADQADNLHDLDKIIHQLDKTLDQLDHLLDRL